MTAMVPTSVTITRGEHGYDVQVVRDGRTFYCTSLTWDECLGQVVMLTMPATREPGRALYPMLDEDDRGKSQELEERWDAAIFRRDTITDHESAEHAEAQADVDLLSDARRSLRRYT